MTWKDRLQDASFRGVPFKVEEESAGTGRRVETHEYPNRDKPYTEDLGKITFRPSITAYVVGDDCFDQRDRLIDALNKPGPGTLVHPTYGELKVCVDGEVRVSTSKSEGRIVRFDLKFVEAGELSYPTSGAATAQTLMSSCSALDDCISDSFSGFSIDGVADFVQNDVVGNASTMLGYVSDAMKVVDSAVSDAARLFAGDISVLLPPPSSGKNFVEQVQKMWRTGKRLYGNASDLVTMIKTLSGVSLGSDLQPRGVWKTDSKTTATATQQRNVVASTLRTTAISEAAYAVTRLPAPTTSAVMQNATVGQSTTPAQSTGWPSVTHPALNNAPAVKNTVDLPTWEELTDIRDTLNTAIDKELSRTTSDVLFLALRRVKADLNADINTRLEQSARIIQRTPDEVLPALVLAATWFDNAARDADIIRRNAITHPGCAGDPSEGASAMNDNVTLRVNGREWNGWTSVRIGAGIERLARDFSVEITRQWPGDEGITTLQPRIKNGSKVEVLIGDELVITGWVEATPVRYDARSVSTGIAGRSLTADLIDCAAEPTQFNGRSLVQIAQALAAPFGIEVVNNGAPSGVIPDVQPDHGETVIEVINKILGQQQALAYDDPHGRLVIGGIGSTRAHTALVLGENILSCDTEKSIRERFSVYQVAGQRAGNDDDFGEATTSAAGPHRGRIYCPLPSDVYQADRAGYGGRLYCAC